jgi:hypothetical protein
MISKICSFFSYAVEQKEEGPAPIIPTMQDEMSSLDLNDTASSNSVILHINEKGLETLFRDLQLPLGDFVIQMDDIGREHIMDILDRVTAERMREVLGM